jgi:antitoxin MazE
MRIPIQRFGDLEGIIVPARLLAELGIENEAELIVQDGTLVIRAPGKAARSDWNEASKAVAAAGDDNLVLPEFPNEGDKDLKW